MATKNYGFCLCYKKPEDKRFKKMYFGDSLHKLTETQEDLKAFRLYS